MISRRFLGKLLASAIAYIGLGKQAKTDPILKSEWKPNIPTYLDSYNKFVNTPYLERMDLGVDLDGNCWGPGHKVYDTWVKDRDSLERKFHTINKQILEFREQEPIKLTGKPLKPMKDCWREAVAEVNAKYM
jgi:hypothetical protein